MEPKHKIRADLPEIEWARLAMAIDGEGTIRIDVQRPSKGNRFTARHLLEVRVYNSDPRLILWCKDTFGGGNVKPLRKKNPKPEWKEEFTWYVGALNAEHVLVHCLPYFIIKRQQAEVALAFRALGGKHGQRVSVELFAKREEMRLQMRELNRRGQVAAEVVQ